jgi:hypothetical protein
MNTFVLRSHDAIHPGTRAYAFRRWVTGVVLPTIRKTCKYAPPNEQPAADISLEMKLRIVEAVRRAGGSGAAAEQLILFGISRVPSLLRVLDQYESPLKVDGKPISLEDIEIDVTAIH